MKRPRIYPPTFKAGRWRIHPTMSTKLSYEGSLKGSPEIIKTTGAKTRINVVGSLNLSTLNMVSTFPD